MDGRHVLLFDLSAVVCVGASWKLGRHSKNAQVLRCSYDNASIAMCHIHPYSLVPRHCNTDPSPLESPRRM
jgi:hypothetical protein